MRLNKGLISCMVLILMFTMAACSTKTSTEPTASSTASATTEPTPEATAMAPAAGPLSKYEPGIEVTAVRPIDDGTKYVSGESLENNVWSRAYEDELGIKINYLWTTPTAQYEQKSNIAIATDDLPDIMQVNAVQLKKLADDGQLEDLTELYQQYAAPFTKQILSEDGGSAIKSATFNGKMLALPKMGSGLGSTDVLWVRTDWLKKLNLPEPKTLADVFNIAEAFTKQDPDGDNKADTYGLGVNKDLWGYFSAMEGFFNGYHAYPNIWVKDSSGQLGFGSIQPEVKLALDKLHELYQAGQIDQEFGTKAASKVQEDINAGKLGMFYGYFFDSALLQDGKNTDPSMEWIPYALPSIDTQPASAQVPFAINTYYVVKKGAKYPEAAIKILNLTLEKIYGATADPEKYSVDKDGLAIFGYTLLYGEAPRKNLDASLHVVDAINTKDTSKLNAEEKSYYDNSAAYLAGDNTTWGSFKMFGPGGALSVIEGYFKNNLLMNDQFFGAPTATMGDSNTTLQKLQMEEFTTMIIRGTSDGAFEQFVSKWKSLGGDKITREVNEWAAAQK